MIGFRQRSIGLIGFGLWGGAALIGCVRGPNPTLIPPEPETPETALKPPAEQKKMYQLGEVFAIRDDQTDVVITFTSSRTHKGEEFLKPKEEHYWYYLTGQVVNQGQDEFVISPDFYTLTDGKKKTYSPSVRAHALKDVTVLQGRIAPDSEKKAEIGFELPKGTKPVLLSFDISNDTACRDSALKANYFCKPILIKLTDGKG